MRKKFIGVMLAAAMAAGLAGCGGSGGTSTGAAAADTQATEAQKEEAKDDAKKEDEKEEPVNSMKALWTRPQKDISDDEFNDFYRHISHDWENPLERIYYKAEGTSEFRALLFIPSRPPMDLFYQDGKHGVQLYIRRVFIMNDTCASSRASWTPRTSRSTSRARCSSRTARRRRSRTAS